MYGRGGKEFEVDDIVKGHFCVIRAIGDTETESGRSAQDRIAKEFFAVVDDWEI